MQAKSLGPGRVLSLERPSGARQQGCPQGPKGHLETLGAFPGWKREMESTRMSDQVRKNHRIKKSNKGHLEEQKEI